MSIKRRIGRSRFYQKLVNSFGYNELRTLFKWRGLRPVNNVPHGHFYSPVVSKNEIDELSAQIWCESNLAELPGIDLNSDEQRALLQKFSEYYAELPFTDLPEERNRYYFENTTYSYTDAIILYSFMRHFKPKRIIEVGSGFSSAVMMDTRDQFLPETELTFIEPYPQSLFNRFRGNDKNSNRVLQTKVQKVPLEEFMRLEDGDILFIDSSHVSKTGSDVNFELFRILPALKKGVIIHFHDVFFPFEYPRKWVEEGRNWNEDYLLRAFLSYNDSFSILHFSHYMHMHHKDAFSQMPLCYKNEGGNLWIRKNK
jgi:hypothetical protein